MHINYVLNPRGRLTYLIGAGVDFNIFMQGNTIAREGASFYVIKNYSILDKEKPFNAVLFSGIGSIGVNYRLSNHLSLFVNSKLNYSLNSVYKSNYLIRYKPVSYGIESGINIKF